MKKTAAFFVLGLSLLISSSAWALNSYKVKLQFTFSDGTTASDTLLVTGSDWVSKELSKGVVKVRVEPHENESV